MILYRYPFSSHLFLIDEFLEFGRAVIALPNGEFFIKTRTTQTANRGGDLTS